MAKGVAAITMDEEYQQKRREAMNKQPSGLREGLARGGKGLVSVRVEFCLNVEKPYNPYLIRGYITKDRSAEKEFLENE